MRDRLEYKLRGACISIDCEPKNVDASCTDSIDRLAGSCIALWSYIECKKVRVIVISTASTSKKKYDAKTQTRLTIANFFLDFFLKSWWNPVQGRGSENGSILIWVVEEWRVKYGPASEVPAPTDSRWTRLSIVYRMVSKQRNYSGSAPHITITDLFMNHCVLSYILTSVHRYTSLGWVKNPSSFTSTR